MWRTCQTALFVMMLLVLGLAARCGAAILADLDSVVPPGTGSGMLSLPIFTSDPSMDGVAGDNSPDNNSLFYDLVFDQTGPLDAQFRAQNNTGGGAEYAVLVNVANQTGADWVAFVSNWASAPRATSYNPSWTAFPSIPTKPICCRNATSCWPSTCRTATCFRGSVRPPSICSRFGIGL